MKLSPFLTPVSIEQYWEQQATELPWFQPWEKVLDWQPPHAQWFVGGKINASYACLDKNLARGLENKKALLWTDETGAERTFTYGELHAQVSKFAHALKRAGVKKGDIVALFMPLIPEAVIAMLAVAHLGAVHSIIFSGFGAEALRDRLIDLKTTLVITADGGIRRGKTIFIKDTLDRALEGVTCIKTVIVFQRIGISCPMKPMRDIFANDLLQKDPVECPLEPVESNHPLFILHTSGSTGKPKGIVHGTGGYLTYVYTTLKETFDIKSTDIYWCTADIGWITGHSYVVYGPLMHGATIFIYEGAQDYPTPTIWWDLIARYHITIFYTAPTALRFFMKYPDSEITNHNLSSLRLLGSVGEPLNPHVWDWYARIVGSNRCPIIDTWWQTETGGFMLAPTKNLTLAELKPGSVMHPLPGIEVELLTATGEKAKIGEKGFLVIKKPWPGMLQGVWGNDDLYQKTYWEKFNGAFNTGDCARKDADDCFWMLGRADEVIKISGHRLGTAEIESTVLTHPYVAEAAAIGIDDTLRGHIVALFVVLKVETSDATALHKEIPDLIHKNIGRFVVISNVYCINKLPKTRSGKILRRVLKALVENAPLGDLTTIEDGCVIEEIVTLYEQFKKAKNYKKRNE